MTTEISREEFLAHMGYLRGDVAQLQASVDKVGERQTATELAIALINQERATVEASAMRRRTSADAFVVAILGVAGAGVIEWVKTHWFGGSK
jgi:hypothetical protein